MTTVHKDAVEPSVESDARIEVPSSNAGAASRAPSHGLVCFDGECGFCDAFVVTALRHDPCGRFLFTPLQSRLAIDAIARCAAHERPKRTALVLLMDGEMHTASDAVLRIVEGLTGWPRILGVLRFVPRPIREVAYRMVAWARLRLPVARRCAHLPRHLAERLLF